MTVVPQASEVGGGALPGASLPTVAVALRAQDRSAAALERLLRLGRPPIIARIQDDRVLLDARTLLDEDPAEIARIVGEVSFGKGLVQSVFPLSESAGLALTTAR